MHDKTAGDLPNQLGHQDQSRPLGRVQVRRTARRANRGAATAAVPANRRAATTRAQEDRPPERRAADRPANRRPPSPDLHATALPGAGLRQVRRQAVVLEIDGQVLPANRLTPKGTIREHQSPANVNSSGYRVPVAETFPNGSETRSSAPPRKTVGTPCWPSSETPLMRSLMLAIPLPGNDSCAPSPFQRARKRCGNS